MFFDVRYRYKRKGVEDTEEKVIRVENAKGGAATTRDLAMACYKIFARRDIEIVSCDAIMYVPKLMAVAVNDEGLVTINGKPIDPFSDIVENEMSSAAFPDVASPTIAAPQSEEPPMPQFSNKPVARQAQDARTEITLTKEEAAKLDMGEKRWKPSPSEASQGFSTIATYDPPKVVVFDPPGGPDSYALPISHRSTHMIHEKIFRRGVRDGFFRIELSDGHIMLPETLFVDAPTHRPDPMLDIQANRPDTQTQVNTNPNGHDEILDRVPLQRADDRRAPRATISANGIIHGLDNVDIRAGRR